MIHLSKKEECCGCSACVERCPKHCITFSEDSEGFLYPSVDTDNCIDCGICESVCPFAHPDSARLPLKVLAAINIDEPVRLASSSGGVFTSLAAKVIDQGGIVFGAEFENDWSVSIGYSETVEGLSKFRGSKYLQANAKSAFSKCEEFLKSGKEVLFSGSPCQIAGLKKYLRSDYGNLLTVDFVCHGVPSPKVWKLYLDEIVGAVRDHKNLSDYKFSLYEDNGVTASIVSPFKSNDYMNAFLKNLILRPSCYHCKVRECRSMSDITIGDYWGIRNVCRDIDDGKGTSLVMLHTPKGLKSFNCTDIHSVETSFEDATASNPVIITSPSPCRSRACFFKKADTCRSVVRLIRKSIKSQLPFQRRIHTTAHNIKSALLQLKSPKIHAPVSNKTRPCNISFRFKGNSWKEYELKIDFKDQ